MELLESTYTWFTLVLLAALTGSLLVVRMMSVLERRLLTGTGLFMAGLFFVARHPGAALPTLVGAILWGVGLGLFIHAALNWGRIHNSRVGAWAALALLPIVCFGAMLAGGFLLTLLAAPAQAAVHLIGG